MRNGKAELVTACHVLAAYGHNDLVWGHVAARAEDGSGIWMKPAGLGMEEIHEDDLILVGWDGEVLSGSRRRHVEYPIHTRIMLRRGEVNATVHSHIASCTEFSSLDTPLRPISHEGCYFAPLGVPTYRDTSDLIVTDELGDAVAERLGDAHAAFLAGHGMVAAGTDLVEAVMAAILLNSACTKQLAAMAAGEIRIWTSEEEAVAKREHVYPRALLEQGWDYLGRSVDGAARVPTADAA